MNRRAYKPPAAPVASGSVREGALDGLPRHSANSHGPRAYVPPRPDGDRAGPDPAEVLAAERAKLDVQREQLEAQREATAAAAQRYAEAVGEVAKAAETAGLVLARDAVAVGVLIAEQLLGRALSQDGRAIAEVVRAALREVPEDADTRVRVATDDLPRVELVLAGTKRSSVELIADAELGPGDCVVESPGLIVDARLRERLRAIGDALGESIPADTRLPTHDEVSVDERSSALDAVPMIGESESKAAPSPEPAEVDDDPDAISLDDAGPDAISLDFDEPGAPDAQ